MTTSSQVARLTKLRLAHQSHQATKTDALSNSRRFAWFVVFCFRYLRAAVLAGMTARLITCFQRDPGKVFGCGQGFR